MHSLLGPLPLSPYQEGKYFTDFKKYVSRNSLVHGTHAQLIISFNVSQFLFFILCLIGHCEKVVNVMKKLKSTDFIFADFVTKLLAFDPCLRLTPMDAIRHPFLAPECASGFISSHGNFSRESGYPSVVLTSETYPYHPFIDEKIKKLHFSDLELLRVGTCRKPASHNVLKVLPLNYQADHSEDVDESSLDNDDQSEGPFSESCYALNTRVSRSDHCRRDPSRKRQRRFFIRRQSKAPRTSQEGLSCSLASTEKYVDNNAVFDDGRTGYSCEKSNKIIAKRGRERSALYCRPSWLKATEKRRPIINTKTKSKCTGAKITSRIYSGSVDKEYAASFSELEKGSNGESGDNHDGIARDASTASCSRKQPFSSIEKFSLNHKAAIEDNNGREEGKKTFLQSSSKSKTNYKDTNTDVQILDEVSKVDAGTSNLDSFFHPFADDDADMSRSQAEEYCKDSILEVEESEEQNCSSEEDYDVVLI
ncbi:uncharacterized protein LOC124452838 isoform X2 [Xenia sp. Carnegie-2017]|uniref:uncharacterized protein LOC124452838 isoform X2 n=1 Tax=Xenia sp. Carnegie-2017 TaxID=2897299 RepID=UPI001F036BF4|nr:uncharacterized protein LOC124452838 isoform X2 [Xenia sp. Carnegie-2017]